MATNYRKAKTEGIITLSFDLFSLDVSDCCRGGLKAKQTFSKSLNS
jgi:hypothetical protein